jgi:polysaccharide transporter, PST family
MKKASTVVRYAGFVFSVGGARVAGVLITSLTFPYLVRRLGVEMYGLWSYVVALCAFLDTIANPGLTAYATQQVAARREAAFDLIPDVLFLRLLSSAVTVILLFVVAFFEVRPDVSQLLRWYGVGIIFVNLAGADYLLGALELFHVRSVLSVIQQGLYAIGIFVFVRVPQDVIWIPVSILASALVSNLAGWLVLWHRGLRLQPTIQPDRWLKILVPSVHYAVSSLMSNLYHRTGHLVVRWFLGEHALGLYAAAVRFVDLLRQFSVIVLNILMPRIALSAQSAPGLSRLTRFAVSILALLNIPLTFGLISTAHLIVPLVLGTKFLEDVSLLRWMAPYVIAASSASLLSGTILYATGRHRAYLASAIAGAAAGIPLYLILTPAFGLTGAGIAFVGGEFVVAATAYAFLPDELRNLWKTPMAGVAVVATFLMVIAVRFVNVYTSQPLIVISAGAVVYAMACGWFVRRWLVEQLGEVY